MSSTFLGEDGKRRCKWCRGPLQLINYHDTEWGYPVKDDLSLFEKLCLEGFQSGLSWRTILAKRDNFRAAFQSFDFDRVSRFQTSDVERLLANEGIVRHRGKIEAVINNAKRVDKIVKSKGSLAAFFWCYEPKKVDKFTPQCSSTSSEAVNLAKDLKRMGWQFVGPVTAHAFMQAMGMINDHAADCMVRDNVERARNDFERP